MGSNFAGKCLLSEWSALLDLGVGELREVCHHGLLVHVGVDDLLGGEELGNSKPTVCQVHGFSGVPEMETVQQELSQNIPGS